MAGRLARLFRRQRAAEPVVLVDDGSLAAVGESFDAARADSDVVAEMVASGVDLTGPVLVRHHLLLPGDEAVAVARDLLAQDGYSVLTEPVEPAGSGEPVEPSAVLAVRASRTQVLTGLSAAQERSRMAGLAQRLGGDVRGWDALAPPPVGSPVDRDG